MKVSKVLLNIASVVCFIYGALYVFSLVFIPVGIYCFIAGRRFSYKAEHLEDIYFLQQKDFKSYVIFASIACFPLGLITIIPYFKLTGNNVKVSDTNGLHIQVDDVKEESQERAVVQESQIDIEEKIEKTENVEMAQVAEPELSEKEKQEKFDKLKNFKDKGIITEEELELAREQLFGKKEN